MKLPYTSADSKKAAQEWKASCGHHSISAASGKSLEDVRQSGVKLCGWMNPTMVIQCLMGMEVSYEYRFVTPGTHPYIEMVEGNTGRPRIFRIQFEGPWMRGAVAGQYRHTHYIACLNEGIVEPMIDPFEVMQHEEWMELVGGMYPEVVKRCTGFHFTHAWTISEQPQ